MLELQILPGHHSVSTGYGNRVTGKIFCLATSWPLFRWILPQEGSTGRKGTAQLLWSSEFVWRGLQSRFLRQNAEELRRWGGRGESEIHNAGEWRPVGQVRRCAIHRPSARCAPHCRRHLLRASRAASGLLFESRAARGRTPAAGKSANTSNPTGLNLESSLLPAFRR